MHRKRSISIFLTFALLCLAYTGFAGVITHTVTFDQSRLQISQSGNYTKIFLPGCDLNYKAGEPQLPMQAVHLNLPMGARVKQVKLISAEKIMLEGSFQIFPVQTPQILSAVKKIIFTEPNPEIYNARHPYPKNPVESTGQGVFRSSTLANFIVHPVQYFPADNQLCFYPEVTFSVEYEITAGEAKAQNDREQIFRQLAQKLTGNEILQPTDVQPNITATTLEPGYYPYIIITKDEHVPDFQPLADWKTKKGVPAKIITTQWLIQNYRAGSTNIIRARNFLKDAVQQWGTVWVLAGGDTNILPVKKCFAMDCKYGDYSENYIPCDLYISDLDCTWNANNNGVFGETDDAVDLYPDIFVGRAPCENGTEIRNFVNKLLVYEKNPDSDYILRMLMAAEILWSEPYTNTGIGQNIIDERYIPDRFEITKLYEDLGNESRSSVMAAMNRGMGIINHDGHAWWSVMGAGNGSLRIGDMDALSNSNMYSIFLTIGCWPAAIDYDCIAEHFVTNPDGGGVAFIGNSRYGWGSPGNPGLGYSDRFIEAFFHSLFIDDTYHIGEALALAKAKYVPYAQQENVYRWCMYQINLLGDPEMPIWTDVPGNLTVRCAETIPAEQSRLTITVLDGQQPLANALVCLMNTADVYLAAFTDYSGQVHFNVSTGNPSQPLDLTVTAHNFLPLEKSIQVNAQTAYLAAEEVIINDQASLYSDSLANPGETVKLSVTIKNYGGHAVSNVQAVLRTKNPLISIEDSSATIGDLAGGAQFEAVDAFSLTFDSSLTNKTPVNLNLVITAAETTWNDIIGLTVSSPVVCVPHISLVDSVTGDNDGYAEAGETLEGFCWFENRGLAPAFGLDVRAETANPYLTITNLETQKTLLILGPHSTLHHCFFKVEVASELPEGDKPFFPVIYVHTQPENGTARTDSLVLTIGKTGLNENMETGAEEWTHSGTSNFWNLDTARAQSGQFSWYSGDPETRNYPAHMNADLVSPTFYLAPNSELSFWAWYDVALYSAWGEEGDGLHVEIKVQDEWKQLDFIGTGGALYPVLMGNDWLPYTYDLSAYETGSEMQVKFRFISDGDREPFEGIYVDDVRIAPKIYVAPTPPIPPITAISSREESPLDFSLGQNYPNPFNPETTIRYSLPQNVKYVNINIYNVLGQKVRTLFQGPQPVGQHSLKWNGRDDSGRLVSSGVYFYQLKTAAFLQTRKMIFMR